MREPYKTNLMVTNCPYRKRGANCLHSQIIKVRKHIHNWPNSRVKHKHYLRIEEYCHLQVKNKLAGVSIQECYVVSSVRGFYGSYRDVTVRDRIRV